MKEETISVLAEEFADVIDRLQIEARRRKGIQDYGARRKYIQPDLASMYPGHVIDRLNDLIGATMILGGGSVSAKKLVRGQKKELLETVSALQTLGDVAGVATLVCSTLISCGISPELIDAIQEEIRGSANEDRSEAQKSA